MLNLSQQPLQLGRPVPDFEVETYRSGILLDPGAKMVGRVHGALEV